MKSYNEGDSENDNESKIKVIMRMKIIMKVRVIDIVIVRMKIVYINVLMRLVSRRGGSLNWTWTPPSSSRRK